MKTRAVRRIACGITVLAAMSCTACSSNGVYPVSGKVTYRGTPAAGAVVSFHHRGGATDGQPMVGIVQKDGTFALLSGAHGQGAPPGEYDVLIEWKRGIGGDCCTAGARRQQAQIGADKLKGRYANPRQPRLHAMVKAQANELPAFALE